jgi:uracil-DNA glycosylase
VSKLKIKIEESWQKCLNQEFGLDYFQNIMVFISEERKKNIIYPDKNKIFSAFNLTPFNKVKVVIIGQDPYHGVGQANGLCFSVNDEIKKPPSLMNIFKEIKNDIGTEIPISGNLEHWAKQGVFLLNSCLTVKHQKPASHKKIGWEQFTDATIKTISDNKKGVIFLLWGKFAQEKAHLIDEKKHHVLKSVHPSPLSAYNGFFGCKHFSKTNEILVQSNLKPIQWVK